jgi:3-deoxy-manno-octulosonate cytidylyltransferase (CMP-KDO synthetase)
MIENQNTVIVIPARMASRRLPGKPVLDLGGKPLIVHAWTQAREAKLGAVLVAAAENEIAMAIRAAGGDAIVTPPQLKTHLDRTAAALELRDQARQYQNVIILAGDMPFIDANTIRRCLAGLINDQVDVVALAAPLTDASQLEDQDITKIIAPLSESREVAYVRDFRRVVEAGNAASAWAYVGVTAYRRTALEKLAATMPSQNEFARTLEQMRALDLGHKVAAVRIDEAPLRIDSRATLERARKMAKAMAS